MAGPSRRRVLLGGAALTAAALLGRNPLRANPPTVSVERGWFTSEHWPGRRVNWVVAYPDHSAPLVIALHSLGTSANWYVQRLDAPGVARRTGLAIAAVDGGRHYWHRHHTGVDTSAMVIDNFLPLLAAKGFTTDRIGLTGVSMGGFGVMHLATLLPPEQTQGIAVVAPALRRNYWENRTLAFDDIETFDATNPFNHLDRLRRYPVAIACGRDDDFYDASRAMAQRLPADATLFTPGAHTTAYVASYWEPVMHWLAFVMGTQQRR